LGGGGEKFQLKSLKKGGYIIQTLRINNGKKVAGCRGGWGGLRNVGKRKELVHHGGKYPKKKSREREEPWNKGLQARTE